MAGLAEAARASKAWPFVEARRLLERVEHSNAAKDEVLFETGYGPSGLPHIGTFGEVVRTSMVRRAFQALSNRPTRLLCFSDDMDGMRKVPLNVPKREELAQDLHLPLSSVRDPFGKCASFAEYNNNRLKSFLDAFGFEYEFASATDCYKRGQFDEMLQRVLDRFDSVMEIMLPSLGGVSEGRKETYSPFLPISPKTGRVLQVPTLERNASKGTIVYQEPDGEKIEVPVSRGHVKLQWKPDWAMRWAAFGVDYEMFGKDLIPSAELGRKICRALGEPAPSGFAYEMFLDERGHKISKSTGTGFSMEEWLEYAPQESLGLFMYQKPQTAKRLFFDILPKTVDEYHQHLRSYPEQDVAGKLANPVWHIHGGNPPESKMVVSYSMLLNIASVASADDAEVIWGFIKSYEPSASPERNPDLAAAVECATRYFRRRIAPGRDLRAPNDVERKALDDLKDELLQWDGPADAEELQKLVYAVGRRHAFDSMRDWFRAIYEVLFGTSQGPRFGGFIALYGIRPTSELIARRIATNEQTVPDPIAGIIRGLKILMTWISQWIPDIGVRLKSIWQKLCRWRPA